MNNPDDARMRYHALQHPKENQTKAKNNIK